MSEFSNGRNLSVLNQLEEGAISIMKRESNQVTATTQYRTINRQCLVWKEFEGQVKES
jgi:hypothetical protein